MDKLICQKIHTCSKATPDKAPCKPHSSVGKVCTRGWDCNQGDRLTQCIPYKEEEMKREIEGSFTIDEVIKAQEGIDYLEFEQMLGRFVLSHYSSDKTKLQYNRVRHYTDVKTFLDSNPRALEWLLEKGLLGEKKEAKFYHIGQMFKYRDKMLKIVSIGNSEVIMINEHGNWWSSRLRVEDSSKITQPEFDRIADIRNTRILKDFEEISS